jgi:prefoldin alpha subunit
VTDEAELRQNAMMLETAKAQLEGLARQQEFIQLAIEEHVRARETVKKLIGGAPGDEIMVPVGADSYVFAKTSDNKDVVVGIGSAVSVQRKPEEAEKILDNKIEELSQAFKKVSDRAGQTEAMIQELTDKVQEQYSQLQTSAHR